MPQQVPVTLTNPTPFPREREPVSTGIPIPFEQAVTTTEALALFDENHQPVACQFTPLAWWPNKERIKWVLLHFQADVPPDSTRTYYLSLMAQTPGAPASSPQIAKAGSGPNPTLLKIDTGKLQTEFAVNQLPSLFETGLQLLTSDDTLLLPGPVQALKLDENGTERAVVCLKGRFHYANQVPADFAYTLRIEFYRDHAFVRVFSTITCTGNSQRIKDASWIIPNPDGEAAVYTDQLEVALKSDSMQSGQELYILQDASDRCIYSHNQSSCAKDERFQGWIHSPKVSAAVRFFWQMYPKSLEAAEQQLRIGLLPQKSRVKDDFGSEAEYVEHYRLAVGESRTHELILYFHNNEFDLNKLNQAFTGLYQPMLPTAPWQWYINSNTLGDLTVRDPQAYPEFEQMVDQSLAMILDRRQGLKLYGDRNFGDDLLRAPDLWNNCEYDYPHVGVMMFLRGSGTDWYDQFALPAARHMINIDIANAGPTAGMVYPHCPGHNSDDPKLGSHSWLQGLLEYYVISGDYLARDVAENTAKLWCRNILASEELYGTERAMTWPLIAMLACYQIFAEPEYLKAAQKLKNRVVSLFNHELGHFEGSMKRQNYPPSYWQVFLIGSPVLESLVMYEQMFPEEQVRSVIVAIAKRLARINWIAELGVWEYPKPDSIQRPQKYHVPKNDRMVSPGVGYAYLYSGDPELWEKAVTAFTNRYGQLDQDGKTMTQSLRIGVRMPALMAKVAKLNSQIQS